MTLATATREGRVSARIVLLRGFDADGFVFYTNYESRKARELDENPQAALVFYWGALQRQVRVTGRVIRVEADESDTYFRSRPRGSRVGAWASPQSRIISGRSELDERVAALEQEFGEADIPRPPFWGGYRWFRTRSNFGRGGPDRLHDRMRYSRTETGWRLNRLAPLWSQFFAQSVAK